MKLLIFVLLIIFVSGCSYINEIDSKNMERRIHRDYYPYLNKKVMILPSGYNYGSAAGIGTVGKLTNIIVKLETNSVYLVIEQPNKNMVVYHISNVRYIEEVKL